MSNLPANIEPVEIFDKASEFTRFLSSETIRPIRRSLSIIPSVIRDISDFFLDLKRLKIDEKTSAAKAELIGQYIAIQERDSQRRFALESEKIQKQYALEMHKISTETETTLAKIDKRRTVELADIEKETTLGLEMIRAEGYAKLADIKRQYDIERRRQDFSLKKFMEALRESARRYDCDLRDRAKTQSELTKIIEVLTGKMAVGQLTSSEMEYLLHLTKFKVELTQCKTFDISEGFIKMFSGG